MNIAICALFLAVALGYSFEAFVARRRQAAMVHDLNRVCGLYMDTLYRASKDPEQRPVLQEFMDDMCEVARPNDKSVFVHKTVLYTAYASWCRDSTYRPKARPAFTTTMKQKGFGDGKSKGRYKGQQQRGYYGILLKSDCAVASFIALITPTFPKLTSSISKPITS